MSPRERDEGPADYPVEDDDVRRLCGIIERILAAPRYQESDPWSKWMLVAAGSLAVAGVIGGVVMYGQLSAIHANQDSQLKQIDRMQSQIDYLIQQARKP